MSWLCFSGKKKNRLQRQIELLTNENELLVTQVNRTEYLSREAMLRSKNMLGTQREGEDGERASKRPRTSADANKPLFEKHFEDLHRNLDGLKKSTAETREENLNLRSNLATKNAEIALFQQKEKDYNNLQKTCADALQLLGSNLKGPRNYSLNEGIKKLVEELHGSKTECASISQRKTELEENMKRLETQNEQRALSKSKEAPKTDEEKEVLRVLSLLRGYEEQLKTQDVAATNAKLEALNKSFGKTYGKEMHTLNVEILKLLQVLKDDQVYKQHESYARGIKSKTDALRETQENGHVLAPDELRKKFGGDLAENSRAIEGQLKTFRKSIFDFPAVEAESRAAYQEIVSALTRECTHLRDLSSSRSSPARSENLVSFDLPADDVLLQNSYLREALGRLVEINRSTAELEEKVRKFMGSKMDKIFLDLEHKLLNNIMGVDSIQVNGYEVIREKRREAIKYAQRCMDQLNSNVVNI